MAYIDPYHTQKAKEFVEKIEDNEARRLLESQVELCEAIWNGEEYDLRVISPDRLDMLLNLEHTCKSIVESIDKLRMDRLDAQDFTPKELYDELQNIQGLLKGALP